MAFPTEAELLNAAYSKSQMQTVFANWLAACKMLPGGATRMVATIADGVIVPTSALVAVDTEAQASADTLTNIDYANLQDGSVLVLYEANLSRVVTLKHAAGGNGQMFLAGNTDRVLNGMTGNDAIKLHRIGTSWFELSFITQDVNIGGGQTAKGCGQIGLSVLGSVTDADLYVSSGSFFIGNAIATTNWPTTGTAGHLIVNATSAYVRQIFTLYNSSAMFVRTKTGTGWGPWVQIMSADHADTAGGYVGLNADTRAVIGHRPAGSAIVGSNNLSSLSISARNGAASMAVIRDEASANGAIITLAKTRSASGDTFDAVQVNDLIGLIDFAGADGSSLGNVGARIVCAVDGAPTVGKIPCRLDFRTTDSSVTLPVSRWQISTSGMFRPSSDNASDIGIAGYARVRNLYLVNNPTVGSDERDKTDIVDSPLGLDFIRALRPVAYRILVGDQWVTVEQATNEDGTPLVDADGQPVMCEVVNSRPGERTHFGLLAQQVKSVLPEGQDFAGWIKVDPDAPESREALRYEQFISPLIKAVQEQQAQIDALRAEVAELRGMVGV